MVGRFFATVRIPATATAPAPTYLTYRDQMSDAPIAEIGRTVSGKRGAESPAPNHVISGMRTSDETSEPATSTPDCRYPRMYPTAMRAGATSIASTAFG